MILSPGSADDAQRMPWRLVESGLLCDHDGLPPPEVTVELHQRVSLLSDWECVSVSKERVFCWSGKELAVHTCDKTMISML